ncbi:MAG: hypothetical protein IH951_15975, partial [Bacteroidetes bacterium]|nr:hypothetical protein [Bacteroidota bacterium]
MIWRSRSVRFFAVVFIVSGVAKAQTPVPGTCSRPLAEAVLDVNNVRAEIHPDGILRYEIPAGSNRHALQTSDVWFGGYVAGDLRVAGGRWGSVDFWSAPLNPGATLPNPNDCSSYDRIFGVTLEDLREYSFQGVVTPDLGEWPWHLGAPVVDSDGVEGN